MPSWFSGSCIFNVDAWHRLTGSSKSIGIFFSITLARWFYWCSPPRLYQPSGTLSRPTVSFTCLSWLWCPHRRLLYIWRRSFSYPILRARYARFSELLRVQMPDSSSTHLLPLVRRRHRHLCFLPSSRLLAFSPSSCLPTTHSHSHRIYSILHTRLDMSFVTTRKDREAKESE